MPLRRLPSALVAGLRKMPRSGERAHHFLRRQTYLLGNLAALRLRVPWQVYAPVGGRVRPDGIPVDEQVVSV